MVRPFTLRQLEYFTTAVELGTFRAAAAECRVTETALAQAISDLEASLGQTLFIRNRAKGVVATGEGLELLALARSLLDQADEFASIAHDLRAELTGVLRIGCYSILSPFIMPSIIADFALPNPGLDLSVVEDDPNALQTLLIEGKLDCVLLQQRQSLPAVELRHLHRRHPQIILAADHPLADEDRVSLRDLANEPMVLLDIPAVRRNLMPLLDEVGIQPNIQWRTMVFETVRSLVARGLGWSVLIHHPPSSISYEGLPLRTIEIADPISSNDVALGVIKGRHMTRRLLAFEQHCRRFFENLEGQGVVQPASPATATSSVS